MEHLYIICPYRAKADQQFRKDQLQKFLTHMKKYLTEYSNNYTIIVCEQNDDKPFNRGMLFNIGHLETKKILHINNINIFSHQNVDCLPISVNYFNFNQFGFKDIYGYPGGLGAMYICNGEDYEKINGYPNNLWGYGADDKALLWRAQINNINVDRTEYNNNSIQELEFIGEKNWSYNDKNGDLAMDDIKNNEWNLNGLNSIKYSIESKIYDSNYNYWHYMCNLYNDTG